MPSKLLFLEFNEVNFENMMFYCDRGALPNIANLVARNGWTRTHSEQHYEELEPWIQWVTAHTGKSLAEHRVFRLGDIINHDIPQIWERLEELGFRVGAISPMNAKHRLRNPMFFVPDPWTKTGITAEPCLRALYESIAQAVNDNAQSRLTVSSTFHLVRGLLFYARPANYAHYVGLISSAFARPWRKAMLLDVLLADVFIREVRRSQPHFATLFLNAAAHIQHHYLFSAACYSGSNRNPRWYLAPRLDPVREIYETYDRLLGAVQAAFPHARIMIATGLHQKPHESVTYYWRLRSHADFLRRIRVPFVRVEPRMSRDFLVVCESADQARAAERRLSLARAHDGAALFTIDNRGIDLFVMLTYPHEVIRGFTFVIDGETYGDFDKDVAFVALKNGEHDGTGYFLDTGAAAAQSSASMALAEIPVRIMEALGVAESARTLGC